MSQFSASSFSLRQPLVFLLLFTLLFGGVYPFVVGGFSLAVNRAGVSDVAIGQEFTGEMYFWGRPSATTPPYNPMDSAASQLGPTASALKARIEERVALLQAAHGADSPVPVDLVTASASGLDPHISPEAAEYQVARVAKARGMNEEDVRIIVARITERPQWALFGKPRVNVLALNRRLDEK